ncbi:sensor histidine kinase [Streptosporangium lutulentum]
MTFLLLTAVAEGWFYLAPLMTIACGVVMRDGPVYPVLTALTVALAVAMWWNGSSWENISLSVWGTAAGGLVVSIVLKLFSVIAELHRTREELAHAAVAEERLRFSRDLHDLLGHTLSVMVVKAQVVRRLAPHDAEAAARQAADVEAIGREALTEVRGAITGYRGRGLAAELASARTALADAGISTAVTVPGARPPRSWTPCWAGPYGRGDQRRPPQRRPHLRDQAGGTVLEIRDDGRGPGASTLGNGLRGLAERTAALGGTLETREDGGFLLRVTIP